MKVERIFALILFVFIFCACEDNNNEDILTDTQWKLEGFVNMKTGELSLPLKQEGDFYYTLLFKQNTFSGLSALNTFKGRYDIDSSSNIKLVLTQQTKLEEAKGGDDQLFMKTIELVYSYEKVGEELNLYYNQNNLLKFKRMY